MKIDEYKARVIALFREGRATEAQWQQMAHAVLAMSESAYCEEVGEIDLAVGLFSEEAS